MDHEEERRWLIEELQKRPSILSDYPIPDDERGQKDLLRGLMNIWEPEELSEEFLKIQDDYLKEESRRKGITKLSQLEPLSHDERLYLWQGDITTLETDAIVNPANSQLLGCWSILHNCADNLIHSAAGLMLRKSCYELMRAQGHEEETGQAKITPGYDLPAGYVIHTVGPIVSGPLRKRHEELLASCYRSSLDIAEENGVKSIAFPCISTGVFMYPNEKAAKTAVDTVMEWLKETGSSMKIVFNVYKDIDREIYEEIFGIKEKNKKIVYGGER